MANKRMVEVFSAACPACTELVELVQRLACDSCEVSVLDMNDTAVSGRARDLGINVVPAVVIDGELAGCCSGVGPAEQSLRDTGIGRPLA